MEAQLRGVPYPSTPVYMIILIDILFLEMIYLAMNFIAESVKGVYYCDFRTGPLWGEHTGKFILIQESDGC